MRSFSVTGIIGLIVASREADPGMEVKINSHFIEPGDAGMAVGTHLIVERVKPAAFQLSFFHIGLLAVTRPPMA